MKRLFTRLSVAMLAIVALVGCEKKGADYTNIIPEQPMVLVEVDGYKTLQEGGIIDLIAPYREQAATMLGSQAGELVKNIILDMDNTGIATEAPMYLFVTSEANPNDTKVVVLAKVGDKAKLDELVAFAADNLGEISKQEKDGATVLAVEGADEGMLGYNDHALVLVAEPDGDVETSEVLALLEKTATPRKTELEPMVGNSRIEVAFEPIFALIDQTGVWDEMQLDAETMAQVEGVRHAIFTIDNIITDGKIINKWTVSGMDEKLFEESVSKMAKVENTFAEYIPMEAWAVVNFAINDATIDAIGKAISNVAATQGIGGAELNLVMSFFSSLSGDVTLALNNINLYRETFDVAAFIGTKDNSIYNYASLAAIPLGISNDTDGLTMRLNANNYAHLGQKGDNILWCGVNTVLAEQSHSIEEAAWFDVVEDKVGYAAVNLDVIFNDPAIRSELVEALYDELDDEDAVDMFMQMIDLLDYAVAYSEVNVSDMESSITFELVLKNDDTNSLKQFVKIVAEQISALAPAMMGF